VRCLVLILSLCYLIPVAQAQEPDPVPADPYGAPVHGVAHHEEMIGQTVPDVSLAGANGEEVALSSWRGKPVLIDLWATWCSPCLAALPKLNGLYAEIKDKGMEFVSLDEPGDAADEDKDAARAIAYLAQHHYNWKNFHDSESKVASALGCDGLPLVVLIDANGKIVYFDFGGHEADLRKAIAGLGPEFASVAPAEERKPDPSRDSPDQN